MASFFFYEFMDLDSFSVHKHAKKELGQYPSILTSRLITHIYPTGVSGITDLLKTPQDTEK